MKKPWVLITLVIIITASLTFLVTFHLFFTTRGLNLVARFLLSKYTLSEDIEIKKIDGTITRALSLQEISLGNLKTLPPGSIVEIKKVELDVNPFDLKRIYVNINNGKIKIPKAEPILFHGTYTKGLLDLNIYSKSIDMTEIATFLNDNKELRKIKGFLNDIDIFVKGSLKEPELTGEFYIEKLTRDVFSIIDVPISINLQFKDIRQDLRVFGEVILGGGSVTGPRTAVVKLQESKILFNGAPNALAFDLKGLSNVEGAKINIALKGTMKEPDINLSSEPSFPKERLLLMLATNKSWKMAESALVKGQMSPDVTKDFIDYFLFAGSGDRLAQFFGLEYLTFQLNDKTKGIGVKKDVTDNLGVSYTVEKEETKEKNGTTVQKVGSEYKLSDSVTVETERELKQEEASDLQDKTATNDKIFLKYKKSF
ncbi:translocation/assembly module TamB domain-containing protein [Candidatus Omnitrophota bacterium]